MSGWERGAGGPPTATLSGRDCVWPHPLAPLQPIASATACAGGSRRNVRRPIVTNDRPGEDAEDAGNPERQLVVPEIGADRARAERRQRRAELVAGANPAVDDPGVLAAERFAGQPHGGRDGGNPVQAVEHGEPAKPVAPRASVNGRNSSDNPRSV